MKPDWKDAPEWANWLAMEPNGDWFWYQMEPEPGEFGWEFSESDRACLHHYAGHTPLAFKESLELRPKTTEPQPRPGSEGQGET